METHHATKEVCALSRCIALEHHPADSRVKIKEDGICQTLHSRMGTGGGNVPLVLEINDESVWDSDERKWRSVDDS